MDTNEKGRPCCALFINIHCINRSLGELNAVLLQPDNIYHGCIFFNMPLHTFNVFLCYLILFSLPYPSFFYFSFPNIYLPLPFQYYFSFPNKTFQFSKSHFDCCFPFPYLLVYFCSPTKFCISTSTNQRSALLVSLGPHCLLLQPD